LNVEKFAFLSWLVGMMYESKFCHVLSETTERKEGRNKGRKEREKEKERRVKFACPFYFLLLLAGKKSILFWSSLVYEQALATIC
jgi:hypothetical protein